MIFSHDSIPNLEASLKFEPNYLKSDSILEGCTLNECYFYSGGGCNGTILLLLVYNQFATVMVGLKSITSLPYASNFKVRSFVRFNTHPKQRV